MAVVMGAAQLQSGGHRDEWDFEKLAGTFGELQGRVGEEVIENGGGGRGELELCALVTNGQ